MEAMPPSPERDAALQIAKDTLAGLPIEGAKAGQIPDVIEIARQAITADPDFRDGWFLEQGTLPAADRYVFETVQRGWVARAALLSTPAAQDAVSAAAGG